LDTVERIVIAVLAEIRDRAVVVAPVLKLGLRRAGREEARPRVEDPDHRRQPAGERQRDVEQVLEASAGDAEAERADHEGAARVPRDQR